MKVFINSVIFNHSLIDGPGLRSVLFFQGCNLRCKGCHNKGIWNIHDGKEMETRELADYIIEHSINKKLTIQGGEPLMQVEALIELVKMLKGFDIAVYTGHEIKDVPKELLDNIKYIKTGPYIASLHTSTKPYVGSTNQEFRRINHEEQ